MRSYKNNKKKHHKGEMGEWIEIMDRQEKEKGRRKEFQRERWYTQLHVSTCTNHYELYMFMLIGLLDNVFDITLSAGPLHLTWHPTSRPRVYTVLAKKSSCFYIVLQCKTWTFLASTVEHHALNSTCPTVKISRIV